MNEQALTKEERVLAMMKNVLTSIATIPPATVNSPTLTPRCRPLATISSMLGPGKISTANEIAMNEM